MNCRITSKIDINNISNRQDMINDLLDFHNETEGDFWEGYKSFLEEIEIEMNKRLSKNKGVVFCGGQNIKLCNLNYAIEMISRLSKNPLG